MALKSVALNHITRYALKQEQVKDKDGNPTGEPLPGATIFLLRKLSARILSHIKDQASEFRPDPEAGDGKMKASFLPNKCAYETVRLALTGWENLLDEEDNATEFKSNKRNVAGVNLDVVASQASMDCLDLEWIRELSEEVDGENTVTDEEEKPSA